MTFEGSGHYHDRISGSLAELLTVRQGIEDHPTLFSLLKILLGSGYELDFQVESSRTSYAPMGLMGRGRRPFIDGPEAHLYKTYAALRLRGSAM